MRALIQRVAEASVTVDGQSLSSIGKGLLVLIGVTHSDTEKDVEWMARKIPSMRIFRDANDQMNLSVQDIGGSLIVVSQFTLYADASKGNRPSFIGAARPEQAEPLYEKLVAALRAVLGAGRVGTGRFGADMSVRLLNDGPVTILLESAPAT